MIFVTGGTGTVGSALLPRLTAAGVPVRALAHSPAGRAKIEAAGAEAVEGDLARPEDLEAAMAGSDHLFLLSPPDPDLAEREIAVIEAAKRAGIGHVVALSAMGASPSTPVDFLRLHAAVDDHLAASGLDYTIIRPAGFMPVHLLPVATAAQGMWFGITGDGPHAYVDLDDIAEVATQALTAPGHAGAVYEVTGPEALSMGEAAGVLSDVLGRTITFVDVPQDQFRSGMAQFGISDWLIGNIVSYYETIRAGHLATTTNTVEQVTGHAARDYRSFADANAGAFGS